MSKNANANGWKFDFDDSIQSMREFRQITAAWNAALQSDDFESNYAFMAAHILEWPFAGDPKDAAAYDEMAPRDFAEAARKTTEALTGFFRAQAEANE